MADSRDDDPPDTSAWVVTVSGNERASDRAAVHAVAVTDHQAGMVTVDTERLYRLATAALSELAVPPSMAVDVACVDEDEMARLNAEHLDGYGPTDVLAFPLDAPGEVPEGVPGILGDVVLCPGVAAVQAAESGRAVGDELDMLLVHGLLHLLGHDHQEPAERELMFGLTDRLVRAFGGSGS